MHPPQLQLAGSPSPTTAMYTLRLPAMQKIHSWLEVWMLGYGDQEVEGCADDDTVVPTGQTFIHKQWQWW